MTLVSSNPLPLQSTNAQPGTNRPTQGELPAAPAPGIAQAGVPRQRPATLNLHILRKTPAPLLAAGASPARATVAPSRQQNGVGAGLPQAPAAAQPEQIPEAVDERRPAAAAQAQRRRSSSSSSTAAPRTGALVVGRAPAPAANPSRDCPTAQRLRMLLGADQYENAGDVLAQVSDTRTPQETGRIGMAGMARLGREQLLHIVHHSTRGQSVFYAGSIAPKPSPTRDQDARKLGQLAAIACVMMLERAARPLSRDLMPTDTIARGDVGSFCKQLLAAADTLYGLTADDIAQCTALDQTGTLQSTTATTRSLLGRKVALLKDGAAPQLPLTQADLAKLADETLTTLRLALPLMGVVIPKGSLVHPQAFPREVDRRTAPALSQAQACARTAVAALLAPALTASARTHALRELAQAMATYTKQRADLGEPMAVTADDLSPQLANFALEHVNARGASPLAGEAAAYVACAAQALDEIVPALERLAKAASARGGLEAAAAQRQHAELSHVEAFLLAVHQSVARPASAGQQPGEMQSDRPAPLAPAQFVTHWEAMRGDWSAEFGVDLAHRNGRMVVSLPQAALHRQSAPINLAAISNPHRETNTIQVADGSGNQRELAVSARFLLDTRFGHTLSVRGSDPGGRLVSYAWPEPLAGQLSDEALVGGGRSFPAPPAETGPALLALSQLAPGALGAVTPIANQAILSAIQSTSLREPGSRQPFPVAAWLPAEMALPLRDGRSMIYCRTDPGPRAHHQVRRHSDGHYQLDVELRYDNPSLRGPDGRDFRSARPLDVSVTFSLAMAADGSAAALVEPVAIRHWYADDAQALKSLAAVAETARHNPPAA